MKHHLTALLLLLGMACPVWAQEPSAAGDADKKAVPPPGMSDAAVKQWREFTNLPKEKRREFSTKLLKAQNLFNQKRVFDALEKIDELDKIFPDHPATLNLRGACYVEIRAFEKANKVFEKVIKLSPDNDRVAFNLAEVDFVTKKWSSAHDRFTKLIPRLPESQKPMIRLCEFKLLLCKLKLGKEDEAVALMNKYDMWDDSPFYYYSRAAIDYHDGRKLEAEKQLRAARFVWQNNAVLAPWQDTLIEFGYIRSFYGGDIEDAVEE